MRGGGRWGTHRGLDVSSAYKRPPGRGLWKRAPDGHQRHAHSQHRLPAGQGLPQGRLRAGRQAGRGHHGKGLPEPGGQNGPEGQGCPPKAGRGAGLRVCMTPRTWARHGVLAVSPCSAQADRRPPAWVFAAPWVVPPGPRVCVWRCPGPWRWLLGGGAGHTEGRTPVLSPRVMGTPGRFPSSSTCPPATCSCPHVTSRLESHLPCLASLGP